MRLGTVVTAEGEKQKCISLAVRISLRCTVCMGHPPSPFSSHPLPLPFPAFHFSLSCPTIHNCSRKKNSVRSEVISKVTENVFPTPNNSGKLVTGDGEKPEVPKGFFCLSLQWQPLLAALWRGWRAGGALGSKGSAPGRGDAAQGPWDGAQSPQGVGWWSCQATVHSWKSPGSQARSQATEKRGNIAPIFKKDGKEDAGSTQLNQPPLSAWGDDGTDPLGALLRLVELREVPQPSSAKSGVRDFL